MLYAIALVITVLAGDSPRPRLNPTPWHLTVGIERDGLTTWLSADFRSEAECEEALVTVAFSIPVQGRVVDLYCIRDPWEV